MQEPCSAPLPRCDAYRRACWFSADVRIRDFRVGSAVTLEMLSSITTHSTSANFTYRSTLCIESAALLEFLRGLAGWTRHIGHFGIAEETWGTTVVFDHLRDVDGFTIAVWVSCV